MGKALGGKRWLVGALLLGSLWVQAQEVPSDIPPGHWAREAVEYLVARGYMVGHPDGSFQGDRPATRYELAMALYRVVALRPELVLDEGAMAALRPLLRELAEEMRLVDRQEGSGQGMPQEGVDIPDLADMRARLDQLEKDLAALAERDLEGQALAEALLQLALLRDRLEMLEKGELPEGLARRVAATLAEAYESRLASIERRLALTEERLKATEAQLAAQAQAAAQEVKAREAADRALQERLEGTKKEFQKDLQTLAANMPETHLFGVAQYLLGTPPQGSKPPEGLYFLGGTLTYDPEAREGNEVISGRAPGHTLLGFGHLRGDEKEGFGLRGLFGWSGAFGFQGRFWTVGESFDVRGEFALRNYAMPLVVFPEFSGLVLTARGEGLGTRYRLSGHALLTAQDGAPSQSLAAQVSPCGYAAYGGSGQLEIPFANFLFLAKGAYGNERGLVLGCLIGDLSYFSYELGVGHDPTSPSAIVPNLGLYVVYGGHNSTLDGAPFGLTYWEGRLSYAAEIGGLKGMVGGFYRSFSPSGDPTGVPPALPLGVAASSGNLWGIDGLVRLGEGAFALQVEGFYRRGSAGSTVGAAYGFTPSLALGEGEHSVRMAYAWGRGFNWDFTVPNPLGPVGASAQSVFSLEGHWEGLKAWLRYDLAGHGQLSLAYRYAW